MGQLQSNHRGVERRRPAGAVFCRYLALAVLCGGLIAAVVLYLHGADAGGPVPGVDAASGKLYEQGIVAAGGEAALHAVRANQWLTALMQRSPLALTVAIFALVAALVLLWIARLLSGSTGDRGDDAHDA